MEENELFCTRCKGKNIVTGQKGFSLGKAAAGGLLLGPLGLLAGTHRSKSIRFTCLDCGNTFSVEELMEVKARIRSAERKMAELKAENERRANMTEDERREYDERKRREQEVNKRENDIFRYCLVGALLIAAIIMIVVLAKA